MNFHVPALNIARFRSSKMPDTSNIYRSRLHVPSQYVHIHARIVCIPVLTIHIHARIVCIPVLTIHIHARIPVLTIALFPQLNDALRLEYRSKLLNPKWANTMVAQVCVHLYTYICMVLYDMPQTSLKASQSPIGQLYGCTGTNPRIYIPKHTYIHQNMHM